MKRFIQTSEDWINIIARIERGMSVTIKEVIEQILNQALSDEEIDNFDEMDSLSKMTIIMDIEDALDINIPLNDVEMIKDRDEFVSKLVVMAGRAGSAE